MTKTLKTIQTFSKVGRIISKIIFILCIVFGAICLVAIGTSIAGLGAGELFKIGGVSVVGLVEKETGESLDGMKANMIAGFFVLVSNGVLAKFFEKYFTNELAAGTPFTFAGAKEMLRIGILTIAVPIATTTVSSIILAVLKNVQGISEGSDLNAESSVILGVVLIVLSFVFKYGAELKDNKITNNFRIKEDK